jgi:putative ABC transport system permease protein
MMSLRSRLANLWRNLIHKDRVEQELTKELEIYLEMLVEQKVNEGLQPAAARRAALIEMGGVEQVKESVREVRMGQSLATIWQDLRYGARMLWKQPGVTLVAALAMALGIGANTTIFSTVDALLLRPFNFAQQERLIVVWEQNLAVGNVRGAVAPGNFTEWQAQNQSCDQLVAIEQHYFNLADGDQPERFSGYRVTAGFFETLGVTAAHGRTFMPEDFVPGREQVIVLKHSFWQERFGADPQIIGRVVTINRQNFTIIGVMPPEFNYPYRSGRMWAPLVFDQAQRGERGNHYLEVLGRLKPEVSLAQAQADIGGIALRAQQQFPDTNGGRNAWVNSLTDDAVRGAAVAMPALIGAALFVLLIACANVANLLLASAAERQREMALRLALGATRFRLVRQLLTESVMLAVLGGTLGLLISLWAIKALAQGIPADFAIFIPGFDHLKLNRTVLAYTFLVSVLTGVLFGLAPAWQASKTNFNEALKGGGKGAIGGGARPRLRGALVVAEIALSLVLLISAGLLMRSFVTMLNADLGIRRENVLALEVALPRDSYQEENQCHEFYDQLLRRVESLPGVAAAGAINIVPISGGGDHSTTFQIAGRPAFAKGREPFVQHRVATPGYFNAIGTALHRGRLFTERDDDKAVRVVLVNETMARMFFPGQEPIGERLRFDGNETLEITGVVADVKNDDLEERADPTVYVPYTQAPWGTMNLIVHTNQEPTTLAAAVRNEVAALDRNLPVSRIKTLQQMLDERSSPKRLMTWTLGAFALVALLLAATGIYAVMSYVVAQRTHEIGVRMALGAGAADVLRLIVARGLKLTLLGLVIGLASALALTRALTYFLFGVTATDPLTFSSVALLLMVVALVACLVPARRATKVDPMVALRHE